MSTKTLSNSHYSTTIRTANQGITLKSQNSITGSRVRISNYGEVGLNAGQTRVLPEINPNTIYTIEFLPHAGAGGEVIVTY